VNGCGAQVGDRKGAENKPRQTRIGRALQNLVERMNDSILRLA
jgi:hypothetical protein